MYTITNFISFPFSRPIYDVKRRTSLTVNSRGQEPYSLDIASDLLQKFGVMDEFLRISPKNPETRTERQWMDG